MAKTPMKSKVALTPVKTPQKSTKIKFRRVVGFMCRYCHAWKYIQQVGPDENALQARDVKRPKCSKPSCFNKEMDVQTASTTQDLD